VGSQYYYFISSLPLLRLGEEPKIDSESFLDLCGYRAGQDIAQQLAQVTLIPRDKAHFSAERAWNAFETCLRNALVRVRASAARREAHPYLREERDAYSHLESQIQEATSKDPRRMEEQLDRLRWQVLDDLSVGHDFDENALFLYRIKLLLVEKRAGLSPSEGQDRLDRGVTEAFERNALASSLGSNEAT